MSSDVRSVRLHLRRIRVLEVVADTPGCLEVAVEAAWSWSRCPQCGFRCRRVHDRRVKRILDRSVSGRETVLLWRRLARRLVVDARVMPVATAARRCGVGWHLVNDLVKVWAALVGDHRRRRRSPGTSPHPTTSPNCQ